MKRKGNWSENLSRCFTVKVLNLIFHVYPLSSRCYSYILHPRYWKAGVSLQGIVHSSRYGGKPIKWAALAFQVRRNGSVMKLMHGAEFFDEGKVKIEGARKMIILLQFPTNWNFLCFLFLPFFAKKDVFRPLNFQAMGASSRAMSLTWCLNKEVKLLKILWIKLLGIPPSYLMVFHVLLKNLRGNRGITESFIQRMRTIKNSMSFFIFFCEIQYFPFKWRIFFLLAFAFNKTALKTSNIFSIWKEKLFDNSISDYCSSLWDIKNLKAMERYIWTWLIYSPCLHDGDVWCSRD